MNAQPAKKTSVPKDFLLLLAIPILVSLIIAAAVFIPRLSAHPNQDFIYAYCPSYSCEGSSYEVNANGHVVDAKLNNTDVHNLHTDSYDTTPTDQMLYYFDTDQGSFRSLTVKEADAYNLDKSSRSADGYSLHHGTDSNGFFTNTGSGNNWYLQNGYKHRPVTLSVDQNYAYESNITFLGWVRR